MLKPDRPHMPGNEIPYMLPLAGVVTTQTDLGQQAGSLDDNPFYRILADIVVPFFVVAVPILWGIHEARAKLAEKYYCEFQNDVIFRLKTAISELNVKDYYKPTEIISRQGIPLPSKVNIAGGSSDGKDTAETNKLIFATSISPPLHNELINYLSNFGRSVERRRVNPDEVIELYGDNIKEFIDLNFAEIERGNVDPRIIPSNRKYVAYLRKEIRIVQERIRRREDRRNKLSALRQLLCRKKKQSPIKQQADKNTTAA